MTTKSITHRRLRKLLEDVQTVYEGKGMVVHPNSFDKLRMEVIKIDNINRLQSEQIEKMKNILELAYKSLCRYETNINGIGITITAESEKVLFCNWLKEVERLIGKE